MRCPKCNFISFDDLSVCAKCANDLSALAKELNGTCIEARPEFFLGSAIQTPSLDEDSLSDSQVLPPLDHAGINFDDTTTGGFAALASSSSTGADFSDFDDSIGVPSEDDVAIELGDIMPIDLDQLDDASVFAGESLVETNSFDTGDFALDLDKTETIAAPDHNAIDLDLTGKFSSQNAELDLEGVFSDIEIDDSSLDFASDRLLHTPAAPVSDDTFADLTPFDSSGGINLDDELIAQLVSFDDDLDSGDSGAAHPAVSESSARADADASLELDDSLVAELTGAFPTAAAVSEEEVPLAYSSEHSDSGQFELDPVLVAELAEDAVSDEFFSDIDLEQLAEGGDEGTQSGPSTEISASGSEPDAVQASGGAAAGDELLDFSDIDVSDLLASSSEKADAGGEDLSSLVSPVPAEIEPSVFVNGMTPGATAEIALETPIEDLTGEFYPVVAESGGVDLDDLDLEEIDVTDLIESSQAGEELFEPDDTHNDLVAFSFDTEATISDTIAPDGDDWPAAVETGILPAAAAPLVESEGDGPALVLEGEGDSELAGLFSGSVDDTLQETVSGEKAVESGLSPAAAIEAADTDDLFDEIDLSELAIELKNGTSGLEVKDHEELLPEIELLPDGEDGEEGPPDLPR